MHSNPCLTEIKSKIQHYDSIEQEIDDVKPIIVLGCTELSTGKVTLICSRQKLDLRFFSAFWFLCLQNGEKWLKCCNIQTENGAKH